MAEAKREEEKDPDEGITGVVAKWKDLARKKKQTCKEMAGSVGNLKTLEHLYTTKQNAENAVKKAWCRILEVRDIITENIKQPRLKAEIISEVK